MTRTPTHNADIRWTKGYGSAWFAFLPGHKLTWLGGTDLYIIEEAQDGMPTRHVLTTDRWERVADYFGMRL